MSEGMIGLVPLDEIRGVAGDLFGKLAGSEGPVFAAELKKFVLKQPCWVAGGEKPDEPPAPTSHRLPMPKEGEIFELKFDNRFEDQPLEMVRGDGYRDSEKWRYTGQKLEGVQTGWFKRVKVGHCRNLKEVIKDLKEHGKPGHGQFRNVFKRTFEPDGTLTGFADPSWKYPDGSVRFPYVFLGGVSGFGWAGYDLDEGWFWVVEVSK